VPTNFPLAEKGVTLHYEAGLHSGVRRYSVRILATQLVTVIEVPHNSSNSQILSLNRPRSSRWIPPYGPFMIIFQSHSVLC